LKFSSWELVLVFRFAHHFAGISGGLILNWGVALKALPVLAIPAYLNIFARLGTCPKYTKNPLPLPPEIGGG